ncbi:hypothetical protein GCM10009530_63800 [Microbispora corallina]|uniref:Uncharacterized protein n=1 Tax=Microbispora corallina TaxID=83302 RepID=A0ABQ4GC16_9ACTN|nr:DUF6093 family protein [Microbispora corallina]GIH44603.1 hypothetical protein Mco01_76030 [Microbispora corallina]
MPFAGHTPIHPRWSEHHRPTSTGLQTARCHITRTTGGGTTDGSNVWHPPAPTTVYTGPCRVGSAPAAAPFDMGDRQVSTTVHTVAIEWDADDVLEGDIVTITAAPDPGLVGRRFRVTNPRYGSEGWERILACSDDLTRREA